VSQEESEHNEVDGMKKGVEDMFDRMQLCIGNAERAHK